MENKRTLEIIRILLQQRDYITIQEITHLLQVSNKTIRNDLNLVADYLEAHELVLCRKTGSGVRIDGDERQKLSLLKNVSRQSSQLTDYSPQARKIYIGLRLITCTENCRIYELASELYVSRATIHKDLTSLEEMLVPYHLRLVRKNNNGVSIEGKERHLRDLMFDLMSEDKGYAEFVHMVREPSCPCEDRFLFESLDYTDKDMHKLLHLIIRSGNLYINCLPFNSLVPALLRIFISLVRVQEDHLVHLSPEFLDELAGQPLYPEIQQLASVLSVEYHLDFPEEELRYLQIHFLSLQNQTGISKKDQQTASQLTDDLLNYWEQLFGRPFTKDDDLREALTAHLGPAITRCRHGITIENPMMDEIFAYYKNTFEVTRESILQMEKKYPWHLNDAEIGYVAIHLAAALDRTKQPLRAILVCHGGIGASRLLMRRLTTQIPELEIISQETFLSIRHADLSQAELIISTLELDLPDPIPVLMVNTLMYDYDILRLKEIVKQYYKKKNEPLPCANVEDLPQ